MANIIPAIFEQDLGELQRKLDLLADEVEWAQIDLADGRFVPATTVTSEEVAKLYATINLEAHLMVQDPAAWIPYLNPELFRRVYFHIEAVPEPTDLIRDIREAGFEVGLAINPETPLSAINEYAEYIDGVLFMSVEPGAQGRPFQPEVLDKIKEFSLEYTDPDIGIDGGINQNNIQAVADAGVTNICVGSAIFADGDIENNIKRLKDRLT